MLRDGLSDEMTFEQKPEVRSSTEDTRDTSVTGRWMSKCKDPEMGEYLAYSRIRKEPSVGESET